MYDKLTHRKKFIAMVMLVIFTILAFFALLIWRSNLDNESIITGITVCTVFAIPCLIIAVVSLIYPFRLKRFADSLDESLDHYLRKSSHRIEGKYYWYKEYFLDLTKLKTIDYSKIKSVTSFTSKAGIGSLYFKINGFPIFNSAIIPVSVSYHLRIKYGWKSTIIHLGDSERHCRHIINIFKQKNNEIEIYTL